MATRTKVPHDGNTACAHVAHATNEVIAIYPITPSSNLGEIADEKSARGEKNIWGTVPSISELQSEAGAVGAVHGSLSAGALTTTFTASQGLLLMIPNMYKLAGELLPTVFHVTARAIAAQGLSIFGDHSDVMAVRQTGFGMLASNNVQEAMDMALICQAAALEGRIPLVHFYDGFRTSHEIQKIEELTFDDMRHMIDDSKVQAFRARSMSPDHPILRGTAQNPDVYFQGRETVNKYYIALPAIIQGQMDKFAKLTGRQYNLYEYVGPADADRIIVIMCSGGETAHETAEYLNSKGEKVGVLKVRMFRPFNAELFVAAIPASVKSIAVLDRTKEPGSMGEPLYEDVRTAIGEAMEQGYGHFTKWPRVIGGRFGLGLAEFTPAMVKAVYDELKKDKPKNHFSLGINDDVCFTSLDFDKSFSIEGDDVKRAMFYGLGADGTVSANKNSIKIISDETENFTQGYFVYDSKKSGAITVSHLRFGVNPIRKPYLITSANFIACHNYSFIEKYDMIGNLVSGGTFLLNTEYAADAVWAHLPGRVQKQIVDKKVKFYVIDALKIAHQLGLGGRINVIMQTSFFVISKVIDDDLAIKSIKYATQKTYGKKGETIVKMNMDAIDQAISSTHEVTYGAVTNPIAAIKAVPDESPDFVKNVTAKMMKQEGADIPVSAMPDDGTWPTATSQWERRNIAVEIPLWKPEVCVQCLRCSLVCPHATIRGKIYDASLLAKAPATFKSVDAKGKDLAGKKYTLQVAPEDCTGCGLCVENCPAKAKEAISMKPQAPLRADEATNWEFFKSLPETATSIIDLSTVKGSQLVRPLFEFSGACSGCGETPYIKLVSQLFGERALISNATGCSSIYGGNLPTTPYAKRDDGRGPSWINSLFEDNAECAFGLRLAADNFKVIATKLATEMLADGTDLDAAGKTLLGEALAATQVTRDEIEVVRQKIDAVKVQLVKSSSDKAKALASTIDYLVKKSVWGFGGDGWAYDIGFGGLDHVIASGKNVNLLVLDTEVYSNTGGQASKSTPMGAVAKFAAGGKPMGKKDMGMIAMSYGYVYVAKIAMLANPAQAVKALLEAEAYDGPSLILAYSHCIMHGIDMEKGADAQKKAVESGHWPLYRYNPTLTTQGKNPLTLDSQEPKISLSEYVLAENRYQILNRSQPEVSSRLIEASQKIVTSRFDLLKKLAESQVQK